MNSEINIEIRNTNKTDLETLFYFQIDKDANYLAAFTSKDPTNKPAYLEKWTKLLSDKTVNMKTIFLDNKIVGSIAKYIMGGKPEITYWVGTKFWGKGIATTALKQFLQIEQIRPIYGRVAFDNFGSKKVLEKCRFQKIGTEKGYANARGREIEEFIYKVE